VHAFIISDLHLGSSETRHEALLAFMDSLPGGATLVLNGDVANDATKRMPAVAGARTILDELRRQSFLRPVIWVDGNNDAGYRPENPGRIEFRSDLAFGRDLYVCHGHQFLAVPGSTVGLQKLMRRALLLIHRDRDRTMHIADYLQQVPPLYRLACRLVSRGAIRFARRNGYAAITCGHTHHAEALTTGGIQYFNTGTWTEMPAHYLEVTDNDFVLHPADMRERPGTSKSSDGQDMDSAAFTGSSFSLLAAAQVSTVRSQF